MALSKRERYIAATTIVAILAVALDRYMVTPLLERRWQTEAAKQEAVRQMENASNLFSQRKRMTQKWQGMVTAGFAGNVAQAESVLLRALRDWSNESGLDLSSLKPETAAQQGPLRQVTVHAVGEGPMRSVAQFLWLVETAELPLKVEEMQIGARKEGADDLSLQLRISTLYVPHEADRPAPQPRANASAGENQ